MKTDDCLRERTWLWSVEKSCSAHSEKQLYRMAERIRFEFTVKTGVVGAKHTWLQQRSKKALTKRKTKWRPRYSFVLSMPRMPCRVKKLLRA